MISIGATTLPLVGWAADPRQPEMSRKHRLAAIRQLVEGYELSAVELTLDLGAVYPQVFDLEFYAAVAHLQQELGFLCTVHLPFLWIDLASLNEPVRRASLDSTRQSVALTQPVQVHTYVLHLWGFTTMQIATQLQHPVQRQAIMEVLMAQAGRSLDEISQLVEPEKLCVENLEDSLFDLALPLIEQQNVSICLDVGHLALQGGSEIDFLLRHQDRIREVHLHDATPMSGEGHGPLQDHLALGQGQVDYTAFLQKLDEVGYDGPVILELNSADDLETSLAQLRAPWQTA